MRNNNINDEQFGQEIPEPKASMEPSWAFNIFAVVAVACVGSILVALTLRLDSWILP